MDHKIYLLYCNKCNWKRHITYEDDIKDLYEYKQVEYQKNIIKNNNEQSFRKGKRKFRCPVCGFSIPINLIDDLQKKIDTSKELEDKINKIIELEKFNEVLKKKELDEIKDQFNIK